MSYTLENQKQKDFCTAVILCMRVIWVIFIHYHRVCRGTDFSSLLHVQTVPRVHSASYKMSTGGVKGVERKTSHPTSSQCRWLQISWFLQPHLPRAFMACNWDTLTCIAENLLRVAVVDMGFTTLITSQVISVAFYSEREKFDKFFSEAPISA